MLKNTKGFLNLIILLTVVVTIGIIVFLVIFLINKTTSVDSSSSENNNNQIVEEPKKLIVLISSDGFGANLIGQNTPFLNSLLSDSKTSYTLDMQTLEQSETMPSHISMVTGLTQEHHGFYENVVDSSTPILTSKTIFDYAIENNYMYYIFVTKDKVLHLSGGKSGSNIKSIEKFSTEVLDDIDNMINPSDVNTLVFIHLRDLDSTGHSYGWGSNEQNQAMVVLDNNLKLLLTDFREEFSSYDRYFIFSADHGGDGKGHSKGCNGCRIIPFIIVSEPPASKYTISNSSHNIYDVACSVLDIMNVEQTEAMDCVRQ